MITSHKPADRLQLIVVGVFRNLAGPPDEQGQKFFSATPTGKQAGPARLDKAGLHHLAAMPQKPTIHRD